MTITPRITVSAIEFVRSRDGSDEREIVCVPLDVCQWLMDLGDSRNAMQSDLSRGKFSYSAQDVLTILRLEAEK